MAQAVINSSDNINIANTISLWFNQDWAADTQTVGSTPTNAWLEFGDCFIDGVSITPDFAEHRSYRNGRNSLRKRLLVVQNCAISATLNEPNIKNFQRVLYGGAIDTNASVTIYEGRHLELKGTEGAVEYFDIATDAGEVEDFDASGIDFVCTGIYATTDVTEGTNLLSAGVKHTDTDGKLNFGPGAVTGHPGGFGSTDITVGQTYYVKYQYTKTSMTSSEIYGATNSTVEGAARLQARNVKGGTVQIWEIASAQLAPNGDLTYPLDAVQQVPVTMTLQERSGTWGKIYTA